MHASDTSARRALLSDACMARSLYENQSFTHLAPTVSTSTEVAGGFVPARP